MYYCPSKRTGESMIAVAPRLTSALIELVWVKTCSKVNSSSSRVSEDKKVKLFRVTVSTNRTEFVVTNDLSQASTDAVQDVRYPLED